MQNHDSERQEEVEEAAELWRLQETSARHKNNREEGEIQTVITRQHEVLSNTLQGGNSERNERNQKAKRKETEGSQTEQTTAHSPLILQGCNSHTHWQHRFSQKTSPHCLERLVFLNSVNRKSHSLHWNVWCENWTCSLHIFSDTIRLFLSFHCCIDKTQRFCRDIS